MLRRICLLILLFSLPAFAFELRVDEPAARITGETRTLELPVHATAAAEATVSLDLLDPNNQTIGSVAAVPATLRPGPNLLRVPLRDALSNLPAKERENTAALRLRYTVAAPHATATGIIALGALQPDLFELEVIYPQNVAFGQIADVQVLTRHPVTRRPMPSVELELYLDDSETASARAQTDRNGAGRLSFTPSAGADVQEDEDSLTIKVVGRRAGLAQESENDIAIIDRVRISLTTDKPLYQPGQPLYMRVLAVDSRGRAAADRTITLEITDIDDNKVFAQPVRTNRYGIASTEWTIPDRLRFGPYNLKASLPDGRMAGAAAVSIRRYDLPNFTVTATPDRKYYLPGQTPTIEVRADYLFGQPVKRGKVRIVREERREWDHEARKWVAEEKQVWEGELDAQGRFRTSVDLSDEYKEVGEYRYDQFRDVKLAAYVTDASTNRTEQRRFDVRLTRNDIHVYLEQADTTRGLRPEFWVTAFYADGEPCVCQVVVSHVERVLRYSGIQPSARKAEEKRENLAQVRTSSYGLARFSLDVPADEDEDSSIDLVIRVRDGKGLIGSTRERYWSYGEPGIRIAADRAVYRPGEPIRLTLSAAQDIRAVVYLTSEQRVLRSRSVRLKRGNTSLIFPYQQAFEGELQISAISTDVQAEYRDFVYGARKLLYPRDRRLRLGLSFARRSHQPGDDALLNVRVRDGDGAPLLGALGVVITDRAVEARARTDEEFRNRSGWGDYWDWWYGGRQLGGIRRAQLDELDPTQPLPPGLEDVADYLLNSSSYPDLEVDTGEYLSTIQRLFTPVIEKQLAVLRKLEPKFQRDLRLPLNLSEIETWAREQGVSLEQLRDPWGHAYRAELIPEGTQYQLRITSAGPDERFATDDDLTFNAVSWHYFLPIARRIESVVQQVYADSHRLITDSEGLIAATRERGLDLAAARDPWGRPYQFKISIFGGSWWLEARPVVPAGEYATAVWYSSFDYFARVRRILDEGVAAYRARTGRMPENEQELFAAMEGTGLDLRKLLDPWGHPYHFRFGTTSLYSDKLEVAVAAGQRTEKITPTTSKLATLEIFSSGPNGVAEDSDDSVAAVFVQPIALRTSTAPISQEISGATLPKGTGGVAGTVTDSQGAVIPGVTIEASLGTLNFVANTDSAGAYLLRGLPPGVYRLRASAPNFRTVQVHGLTIAADAFVTADLTLEVASSGEVVEVTGTAPLIEATSSLAVLKAKELPIPPGVSKDAPLPMFTPRLREYFPETLLWRPFVETDRSGRARIPFKLADNITTWKVSAVGTTQDGRFGAAEVDLLAFQPFFVEHDPPKFLTDGDEIRLPVPIRNFLAEPQDVQVTLQPAPWFELGSAQQQRVSVPAGDVRTALFPFRVTAWARDAKQRVTAANQKIGDAIEKPIIVLPHGEERSAIAADLLRERALMRLDLPLNAMPGTMDAELKLYPGVLAHLEESIEAVMHRPYGCAEQTISSSYPSLLMLQYLRSSSVQQPALSARAQRYLRLGYDRLLDYQKPDGAFAYWRDASESNLALTAYALRFLREAAEFIPVNQDVLNDTESALIKAQQEDGSWRHERGTTAYVARVLALRAADSEPAKKSVARALDFLKANALGSEDSYAVAVYALAAFDAGDAARAAEAVARLHQLRRQEARHTYWSLDSNTPFYGWGRAGRLETTALAVSALQRSLQNRAADPETTSAITGGILYLLGNKDRYGIWFSGQTTVNVLQALIAVAGAPPTQDASATLLINGKEVQRVVVPASGALMRIPIGMHLSPGENLVELRSSGDTIKAAVQSVATYYVPWPQQARAAETTSPGTSSALRLKITFDRTTAAINEPVKCSVEAERIGRRGYGMMLAEIGLPPGAEVERESLVSAFENTGWDLSSFEVQPDRVVLYLWPHAGGSKLDFTFRPRFGMKARSAASQLYDYYNPDGRTVVAPELFTITDPPASKPAD